MTPPKKGRVVWLVVHSSGIAYGGEWEARKKDAEHYAKNMSSDDDGFHVLRAVIILPTPKKKERTK